MNVAVLGAGGTIGPAIARDLAGSEEVSELRLLDIDEGRARAVAEAISSDQVSAARADAADPAALATALGDSEAVVNSASYRLNLNVMQACLEAGCHYLDLGGLYWVAAEQLQSFAPPDGEDRFEQAGLLAVLGIGSSPGKTNLMALRAQRELTPNPGTPGRDAEDVPGGDLVGCEAEDVPGIDSMDVSAAGRDLDPPSGFSVPSANTVSVHVVDAVGGGRSVRVRSVTRPVEGLGLGGGGVVSTAAPSAAAVRLIARGSLTARGVHPPERCIDPDEMFAELERRGSVFDVELRVTATRPPPDGQRRRWPE